MQEASITNDFRRTKKTHLVLFFECIVKHPIRDSRVGTKSELESSIENRSSDGTRLASSIWGLWFLGAGSWTRRGDIGVGMRHCCRENEW